MSAPLVRYIQKTDNLPSYRSGRELHITEFDRGWVEYLNESCDVYYTKGIPSSIYDAWKHEYVANFMMSRLFGTDDHAIHTIGLYQRLAKELFNDGNFIMPLFADMRNHQSPLTCGISRFIASVISGLPANEIKLVYQVEKNSPNPIPSGTKLTSTNQASTMCELDDESFFLNFNSNANVVSSVLRNSIYDSNSLEEKTYYNLLILEK